MTSSTWTSESALRLIGCGIDAERPARFEKLVSAQRPWRLVYSEGEVAHVRTLADQALGFCAAFCCKEAVVKALEESFPFPECEAFFEPPGGVTLRLSRRLARKAGVRASEVRLSRPSPEELVAVVYLYGDRLGRPVSGGRAGPARPDDRRSHGSRTGPHPRASKLSGQGGAG